MSLRFWLQSQRPKEQEEEDYKSSNKKRKVKVDMDRRVYMRESSRNSHRKADQPKIQEDSVKPCRQSPMPLTNAIPGVHLDETAPANQLSEHLFISKTTVPSVCKRNRDHTALPTVCPTPNDNEILGVSDFAIKPSFQNPCQAMGNSDTIFVDKDGFVDENTMKTRREEDPRLPSLVFQATVPHTTGAFRENSSYSVVINVNQPIPTAHIVPSSRSPSSGALADTPISEPNRKDLHESNDRHSEQRNNKSEVRTPSTDTDKALPSSLDRTPADPKEVSQSSIKDPNFDSSFKDDNKEKPKDEGEVKDECELKGECEAKDEGRQKDEDQPEDKGKQQEEDRPKDEGKQQQEDKPKDKGKEREDDNPKDDGSSKPEEEKKEVDPLASGKIEPADWKHSFVKIIVGTQDPTSAYLTRRMFKTPHHFLKGAKALYPLNSSRDNTVIYLPDLEPGAFEIYLEYACTGHYGFPKILPYWELEREGDDRLSWQECWPLINACILGVRVRDEVFTNHIMDLLATNVDLSTSPDDLTISHLLKVPDVPESLKGLVANAYIGCRKAGIGIEAPGDDPDTSLETAPKENPAGISRTPKGLDVDCCRPHVHGSGNTCYMDKWAGNKKKWEEEPEPWRTTTSSMSEAPNEVESSQLADGEPSLPNISSLPKAAYVSDEWAENEVEIRTGVESNADDQDFRDEKEFTAPKAASGMRRNSLSGSEDGGAVDDVPLRVKIPCSEPKAVKRVHFKEFPPYEAQATAEISEFESEYDNMFNPEVEESEERYRPRPGAQYEQLDDYRDPWAQ